MLATVRKTIGALLGGATGVGIAAVLANAGLDLPDEQP